MKSRPKHRRRRFPLTAVVVGSVFALAAFSAGRAQAKIFPNEHYQIWALDPDRDRIDDRLERMQGMDTVVDAAILFDHCLTARDTAFVAARARISYIGKYVQTICVRGARIDDLTAMLNDPFGDTSIFRIELAPRFTMMLDTSCRAVKARESGEYPVTAWSLGYRGQDVVIAILDCGVDDTHEAFSGKYLAGYDAIYDMERNPDPLYDHGTHVAGIAMGADPSGDYLGVAPDARLVDVRVALFWDILLEDHLRAVEWCISKRDSLGIKVLNLSYGGEYGCDGKCVACMVVDAAVDHGLTVCAAAGNEGHAGTVSCPSAADGAISVGASADVSTVVRNDDTLYAGTNCGPRVDDGDEDIIDEQKPDVAAPGVTVMAPNFYHTPNYVEKTGTSMASPHVAGLAAVLLSANPELTPGDLKTMIRSTATDLDQNPDPTWIPCWGKGTVDAYGAICSGAPEADLYIRSDAGDIYPEIDPPRPWEENQLHAIVRNAGPSAAERVAVIFFTNRSNLGYGGWTEVGRDLVDVPAGGTAIATVDWTPKWGYQCLRARAVYCADPDLSNNEGEESLIVRWSLSSFTVEVGAPYAGAQQMVLRIDSYGLEVESGWTAEVSIRESADGRGKAVTRHISERCTTEVAIDILNECCPVMVTVAFNQQGSISPSQYSELVLQGWVGDVLVGEQTLRCYGLCNCGGSYPTLGDLTCDGIVDKRDVACITDYVYKGLDRRCFPGGWNCPNNLGDVNCDGRVDQFDVTHYVDYVYKNIVPFPCEPCNLGE